MTCKFCQTQFDAATKAKIGVRTASAIEVKTRCPKCREVFYTFFVPRQWSSEREALAPSKAHQEPSQPSTPEAS